MKNLILLFLLLTLPISLQAANIYVDSTTSDCVGNYSIANRTCTGSDGYSYDTVQEAVTAMSGGDDIYLRGGTTYYENVAIPSNGSKDGTSGDWSSIQSYQGEWAIIDGQHNTGYVLGYVETGSLGNNNTAFWKFERLEVMGGCISGDNQCYGIGVNGGPFIFRYLYIHDNYQADSGESPGGIGGYVWQDSTVEYNLFYNNGDYGGNNGGDVVIYSDYRPEETDVNTGSYAGYYTSNNTIRYNYFTGGDFLSHGGNNGVHQKSIQDFTDDDYSLPNIYEDYGDDIHHNIFIDYTAYGIEAWQEFVQVHNNILDASKIAIRDSISGTARKIAHSTVYNNTVIGAHIMEGTGNTNPSWTSYVHWYSNIVDSFGRDGDGHPSIAIARKTLSTVVPNVNSSHADANYIYRSTSADDEDFSIGNGFFANRRYTLAEFDALISGDNFVKDSSEGSDNLFEGAAGADQYITRGAHLVEGETTIADGGANSTHPYLSETLPLYIGATNPDDNNWVAGVLAIDVTYLTSVAAGSDPTWVEGVAGETAQSTGSMPLIQ